MNVARLNFSHGTHDEHEEFIKKIRELSDELDASVAVLQDLQGPKIRVGVLPEDGIPLSVGDMINFDTSLEGYTHGTIPVDYELLHEYVKSGERMLLNDGRIEVRVVRVSGTLISAEVLVGGLLSLHKGINIPDSQMKMVSMTEKDKKDLFFGIKYHVDMVALSFVTSAKDILDLKYLIKEYEEELGINPEQPIKIIAKIERNEAVENIKEILDVADGIMVARGDLGIEVEASDVPLIQKNLIDMCLDVAKPVIVATQMLDSMQKNPRPTRAEVSDVANAVIDHTDAVMLSNETAMGEYPIETVETMAEIIKKVEKSNYDNLSIKPDFQNKQKIDEVISQMSRLLAEETKSSIILAASISGETGRMISRYRPELPVVVATSTKRVANQLNLSWGVFPFVLQPCRSIEELVDRSILYLKQKNVVKKEDKIIIVAGEPVGHVGHVNLLEVKEVK